MELPAPDELEAPDDQRRQTHRDGGEQTARDAATFPREDGPRRDGKGGCQHRRRRRDAASPNRVWTLSSNDHVPATAAAPAPRYAASIALRLRWWFISFEEAAAAEGRKGLGEIEVRHRRAVEQKRCQT